MAIRHSKGITLWHLRQKLPNLQIRRGINGISEFLVSEDKKRLVYCNEHNQIVQANLMDQSCNVHISLEDMNIKDMTIIGKGEVLLHSEVYIDSTDASSTSIRANSGQPFCNSIILIDICKAHEIYSKSQDQPNLSFKEFNKFRRKTISLKMFNDSQMFDKTGQFTLLKCKESISCYSIICNKGFDFPLVFENDRSVAHLPFYSDKNPKILWKGTLLVGTVGGTCFQVDFSLNEMNKFVDVVKVTFVDGKPKILMKAEEDKMTVTTIESSNGVFVSQKSMKMQCVVHDYKRFLDEGIDAVIINFKMNSFGKSKFFFYAKHFESKEWSKAQFKINTTNTFSGSNYFKICRMDNRKCPNDFQFYFANNIGIGLVDFARGSGEIRLRRFFDMQISDPSLLVFCPSQKLFLIPLNNAIEIWSQFLTTFIHKLQFDSNILSLYLSSNLETPRMLVYEQTMYHEIDLLSLRFLRQLQLVPLKDSNQRGLIVPLSLDFVRSNRSYNFPFFRAGISSIDLISNGESFDLFKFPFTSLASCFSQYNYKGSIRIFAKYYFKSIEQFDYIDCVYGPMNPLIMAIYQNDMTLLEELLEQFRYPREVQGYLSPLTFAFSYQYNSAVHILCEYLLARDYQVDFSRSDFQHLLDSNLEYCHRLLATIPQKMDTNSFPMFLRLQKRAKLIESENLITVLCKIQYKEKKVLNKISNDQKKKSNKNETKKIEIESFQIPFEYSYSPGTLESLNLLEKIAYSESNEFVNSLWSEVVEKKWNYFYVPLIIKAFLFFFMLLFVILILYISIFNNTFLIGLFFLFFYIVLAIFISYTIIEITAFCFFRIKK